MKFSSCIVVLGLFILSKKGFKCYNSKISKLQDVTYSMIFFKCSVGCKVLGEPEENFIRLSHGVQNCKENPLSSVIHCVWACMHCMCVCMCACACGEGVAEKRHCTKCGGAQHRLYVETPLLLVAATLNLKMGDLLLISEKIMVLFLSSFTLR